MFCPRSGNGIPYLALRPTRNRLVNRYFNISIFQYFNVLMFLIFILVGSKNPLPLDMGSVKESVFNKYLEEQETKKLKNKKEGK